MGLYAAKALHPHITLSCFPHQGHREAQGAPRHQNAFPFHALSGPPPPPPLYDVPAESDTVEGVCSIATGRAEQFMSGGQTPQ